MTSYTIKGNVRSNGGTSSSSANRGVRISGKVVLGAKGDKGDKGDQGDPATNLVTSVNGRQGVVTGLAEQSDLTSHIDNTSNPHSVTKAQVGLGNVDNTSDVDKPVSTATQTALNGKVSTTGNETIAGVKTFTSAPIAPSGTSIGGVLHLTGLGYPNGVVSASVGSIYIDTNITNGASSWIKKSGTGNTGWQVLEGDTGWRDIASLVDTSAFDSGVTMRARIRREGSAVELLLDITPIASSTGTEIQVFTTLSPLAGFRPSGLAWERSPLVNTGGNAMIGYFKPGDNYKLLWTAGGAIRIRFTSITAQDWPTTLPGTAV